MEVAEQSLKENVVGRVVRWKQDNTGDAELGLEAMKGDLVYFVDASERRGICRITSTTNGGPLAGLRGTITLVGKRCRPPVSLSPLYKYEPEMQTGSLIELGKDESGKAIKVRVNALFKHSLILGKTLTGKTEFAISMAEELISRQIPHLIIDPQGEFTNLGGIKDRVTVTTSVAEALDALQERKTVVFNLIDLPYSEKVSLFCECITSLIATKEKDYATSDNYQSTQFPPVLITIDEADLFGPERSRLAGVTKSRALVVDLVKRCAKYGIGVGLIIQRLQNFSAEARSQCRNVAAFHLTDPSDVQILTIFSGNKIDKNIVQGLSEGESYLLGSWIDYPTVVQTRPIQTGRTKSLDFETILKLKPEQYKREIEQSERQSESETDAPRHVCSECGKTCEKIPATHHSKVDFNHNHLKCPQCHDEYCTVLEQWVHTPVRVKADTPR